MGGRNVDLAHRAADYAYKLIAIHVKQEYDNQITTWAEHINNLLASAKAAYKRHNGHLQAIQQQKAADQETAMLALSLLAGPALSWIAGTVQYKTYPRLVGKRKLGPTVIVGRTTPKPRLPMPHRSQNNPRAPDVPPREWIYTVDPLSHDKVAAKVFGDLGGTLTAKLLVNPSIKAAAPDEKALQQKVALVGDAMSLDLFETSIKNALEEGRKYGQTAIANYAGTILEDREYGDKWIARLNQEQASLKNAQDGVREDAIRRMIREAVDVQRRDWATSDRGWLYYGNNPAPYNDIVATNSMEAEIWRLWIAGEHFEFVKRRRKRRYEIEDEEGSSRIWAIGDSDIEIDLILDRLVDIGVFAGRNQSEMDKIFKRIEDANNRLPPDPNPPQQPPWGRTMPLDPETARRHHEELRKPAGLLPVEVAEVEGIIDTPEELNAVLEWAATRQPHVLGGKLAAVARPIAPINPANLTQ